MLDDVSASFVLHCSTCYIMCMGRLLGSSCTSVYIAEHLVKIGVPTWSCYLVWTILLWLGRSSKLASWSDW